MKSNSFLRLIIFSLCLFSALPARAEAITETEAKVWTQDKGQRLLNAFAETDLKKRYAELDTMFLNFVDLDYISKFVLGKYWRRLNEKEKTDYQQLFKRYALSVYKSFPLEFDTSQIEYTITGDCRQCLCPDLRCSALMCRFGIYEDVNRRLFGNCFKMPV